MDSYIWKRFGKIENSFVQAATVARYPAATRLVADCKSMKGIYGSFSFADFSINAKTNGY